MFMGYEYGINLKNTIFKGLLSEIR